MQANNFRNQLITQHADIARRIALKVARRCPDWVSREDLIAAGMLGLTEAALRYDESRTEPFLSFAEQRIRGAVLDELRRGDLLPRRVRQLARKVGNAIREVEATSGEGSTDQRVADHLGVSLDKYRTGLAHLVHVEVESIDDKAMTLATQNEGPEDEVAHRQLLGRVKEALQKLELRDVRILGLHYIEDLTYQEIAKTEGITPSRVCQLLWRAVDRLRAHLGVESVSVQKAAA